jgi:hypothetical protein
VVVKRRDCLRAGALAGVAGTAGCSLLPVDSATLSDLAVGAAVVDQPTPRHPARVRVEVACPDADIGTASIMTGPALVFTQTSGEPSLFLDPDTELGDVPPGVRTEDGCWRLTGDQIAIRDIANRRTVSPGSPLTETYDVYTFDEAGCLSRGRYEFAATTPQAGGDKQVRFTLALRVGDGKTLSVDEDGTAASVLE